MIGRVLKEALAEKGQVYIEGLGTFSGENKPASIHFAERTVSPVSLSITFGREVYEGFNFETVLRYRFGFGDEQTKNIVERWVNHANHSLDFSHRFEIAGFGLLKPDLEGVIRFEPKPNENYAVESFGLPVVKAEMLATRLKKQEREAPVIPLHPYESAPRSRDRSFGFRMGIGWVSAAAVSLALLTSFAVVFYLSNDAIEQSQTLAFAKKDGQTQKAVLVPEISVGQTKNTPVVPEAEENTAKSPKVLQPALVPAEEKTPAAGPSFYVVAGSFRMEDKSRERQYLLAQKGFAVQLLYSEEKALTRVSIGKFISKAEAVQFLNQTQPKFEDQLWVLTE